MSDDERPPPSPSACGWCGRDPASGFATIDGVRYCHGDDLADANVQAILDSLHAEFLEPTCYQEAFDYYSYEHVLPYYINIDVNPRYL